MNDFRPKFLSFSTNVRGLAASLLVASAFSVVFGASLAHADDKKAAPPAAAKGGGSKRTTINFEDQLVEGQTQKPELFYLLQQRNNNFKRLIRLRENFLPEMRKTSEDISHSSGKGTEE